MNADYRTLHQATQAPLTRPRSVATSWINWLGTGLLALTAVTAHSQGWGPGTTLVTMIAAFALPVIALEWLTVARPPRPRVARGRTDRVALRTLGFYLTFATLAAAFWVFPYTQNRFVTPLLALVGEMAVLGALAVLLLATPAYLWLVDAGHEPQSDGAYAAGLIAIGKGRDANLGALKQFALGWTVKAFFLPLMISFLMADVNWFLGLRWDEVFATFSTTFEFLFRMTYVLDVTIAIGGYLLTMRLFNSHIRSTEPTTFGWLVCLICYPPFWGMFYDNFAAYDDAFTWGAWLTEEGSVSRTAWGCAILALNFIYLWGTVQFGIRFSNLTHRGIITNGPYRWTKHPAYIAKNTAWWMISVPFMGTATTGEAVRMCLMLLLVNVIYYLRAKTEERHLMADPDYRAYAAWIDQHGLFAKLTRRRRRWVEPDAA